MSGFFSHRPAVGFVGELVFIEAEKSHPATGEEVDSFDTKHVLVINSVISPSFIAVFDVSMPTVSRHLAAREPCCRF